MKGGDGMRLLLGIIVTAAALWAGYWVVGAQAAKTAAAGWFEARRAEGWAADYGTMTVQGFPNRFDTVFTDVALADPETGLAWNAPRFQFNTLSYRPDHVIAVWPDAQRVATPRAGYDLASRDMRASLVVTGGTRLALERSTLTADMITISPGQANGTSRVESLTLAAERDRGTIATYRLGLRADGLGPAPRWKARVDPAGRLPEDFDAFTADMTVAFDKPWDRTAIEVARPQPTRIKIRLAEARWGRLELQAAGTVDIGADGRPVGEVTVKARNWRDILDMAVTSGAVPQGLADTLRDGLSLVSRMAGNPRTLDIPLGFRNGRVMLGPVPVAAAPVLRLR
ncbi:DUF2125 domain-containing protein [Roseovarius sp. SYSU LYC5161]|uniref:DUF2125 domain-containing protein n=1 Tax=Roseovarius halophilus (ex Wu et al. 2025) TaxID=3376060 RepID=UPI00399A02B4